ncbi:MAG: 2,3-bisphosphoglycerate-independent phosphoglycerate mutase, partial [Gaiella sp.]
MTWPLVALVILDGWGVAPPGPGNAVELADTPVFDELTRRFPSTQLAASGGAVGLPEDQMGNSEVGHLTIGSGRILFQDLVRVNRALADGSLFANVAMTGAFRRAAKRGGRVHLLGLVSYGGVHSHINHLRGLLTLAAREGMAERTLVHAFTDGRDVSPTSGSRDLGGLTAARIATVCGRYYAMDRDSRLERTDRALQAILAGTGERSDSTPVVALQASYERGVTDEFVEPLIFSSHAPFDLSRDTAVFFNFRPDRGRQLARLLVDRGVDLTTMTRYDDELAAAVAFPEQLVRQTLAETLSAAGLRQLHAAETEKYAHVTYFLNGGVEAPWPGEERILVPSPRDVPSYDHAPGMSADALSDRFCGEIGKGFAFAILNFANPDMVGHTGVIPAVIEAVETVDACLGRVVDAV